MGPIFRLILATAIIVGPPIYLANYPSHFTPLVDVLFSILLTFFAYQIGQASSEIRIAAQANDRWLPQAESVIRRLLTLHTNVYSLAATVRSSCDHTACEMPELEQPEMKAVRVKLKADCSATSQRLDDICNQLEDAVADWERFVAANCAGDDCARIAADMAERRMFLSDRVRAANEKIVVEAEKVAASC